MVWSDLENYLTIVYILLFIVEFLGQCLITYLLKSICNYDMCWTSDTHSHLPSYELLRNTSYPYHLPNSENPLPSPMMSLHTSMSVASKATAYHIDAYDMYLYQRHPVPTSSSQQRRWSQVYCFTSSWIPQRFFPVLKQCFWRVILSAYSGWPCLSISVFVFGPLWQVKRW